MTDRPPGRDPDAMQPRDSKKLLQGDRRMQHIDLGTAVINPLQPVVAGAFTTLTFT